MPQITQIQVRRDTEAAWVNAQTTAGTTPVLAAGEIGYIIPGGANTNVGKFKIGDGVKLWGALPFSTDSSLLIGAALTGSANTFTTGNQLINTGSSSNKGLIVRNSTSQSANPIEVQNTTGTPLLSVDPAGKVTATDFQDSSMATAGVVTNTAQGLFQSTTAVPVANGGTGATTVSGARSALGIGQQYPPMVSNAYYKSPAPINATAANIAALNTMYFFPFYVGADTTFKNIGVQTGTVTTSSSVQIGIYRDSAGVPATLVYDSGDFTIPTSASITYNAPASFSLLTLTAGWYWMGAALHGSAASNATFYCYATNVSTGVTQRIFGGPNIPYSVHACYMTAPASTALPSTPNTLTFFAGFNAPVVSIQVN